MACKYKINGVWYSEEEVKSIFEQSEKKSKEYYALVDKLESATPEEKQDIEAKIAELDKEFLVESKEELPSTVIPETTENVSTESLEDTNEEQVDFVGKNDTVYQNTSTQSNEEFITSEKTIRDLSARISDRIGIPVRFESDRTKKYKGKLENDIAYINLAYATLDTPIHEILGHPIIRIIKNGQSGDYLFETEGGSQLYKNLLKELEYGKGKEVLDRIKRDYVNKERTYEYSSYGQGSSTETTKGVEVKISLEEFNKLPEGIVESVEDDEYLDITTKVINVNGAIYRHTFGTDANEKVTKRELPKYTLEEQQEEAIVELLGLMTAEKLDKVKGGKLISLLKRLLKEMKAFMRSLLSQREVEVDKLPDNMTLGDLADLLAYSNSKLILPNNEVIYTTPDNQQFKTYQEASKHISDLTKSVKDVDLSDVNVTTDLKVLNKEVKYPVRHEDYDSLNYPVVNVIYNEDGYWELVEKPAADFMVKIKGIKRTKLTDKDALNLVNNNTDRRGLDSLYNDINSFIEKNKEYEQSKEIIEEWKKVNNIQYNPEEVYSRGQEFVSVVGAYSDFDVNLMMQNLLQHIEDNQKAGGEFAISAFTKPVDKTIGHLEGGGGKIKFKIYPQSKDIRWAANIDVFSGSVWDASEKVNKDKKSELLGVSYTKYPSLNSINSVQPNLASIIDDLAHHHNELGISLTGNNFRLEYDEDIPYSTKKIISGINNLLDAKYGKIENPIYNKLEKTETGRIIIRISDDEGGFYTKTFTDEKEYEMWEKTNKRTDHSVHKETKANNSIQPTQTKDNLKESIEDVKNRIIQDLRIVKNGDFWVVMDETTRKLLISTDNKKEAEEYVNKFPKTENKEYTEQALINTKIAKLKEVAKKYPRSLIRSEVRRTRVTNKKLFEDNELPFQLVGNTKGTPKQLPTLKLPRSERDVVKPSQVLMPWKFKAKMSKYIKNGKLDMSKIDPKILTGFGMRIPNQGPNSQVAFEIVGFLPKEAGDQIIASKDLVTQMGHDFDFDTMYTYLYDSVEVNGVLTPITSEIETRILNEFGVTERNKKVLIEQINSKRERLAELRELKELTYGTAQVTKDYEKLTKKTLKESSKELFEELKQYKELSEIVKGDLDKLLLLQSILNSPDAALKNELVDTHIAVHNNPSSEVQKQIKRPIGSWILADYAKKMDKVAGERKDRELQRIKAINEEIIKENATSKNKKPLVKLPVDISPMSDLSQTTKFISGTAGNAGVGVYSLYNTFLSVMAQKEGTNPDEQIIYKTRASQGKKGLKDWYINIGGTRSNGRLCSPYTIDGTTLKTEVAEGFQSVSVDNANDVVMDKINLNKHTFKFTVGAISLGFSEQIPRMMTQPIIKDYVAAIQSGTKVGSVARDVEKKALKEVEAKYKAILGRPITKENDDYSNKIYLQSLGDNLTVEKLDEMIALEGNSVDFALLQLSALTIFKELENVGASIQGIMGNTNTDSAMLSKNLIETSAKQSLLESNLQKSTITNIDKVLGYFKGYSGDMNNLMPTTINGAATKYGLVFTNKLWNSIIPYNDPTIKKFFTATEQAFSITATSVGQLGRHRETMWSNLKSFLFTNPNLLNIEGDVVAEKNRLFIDRVADGNKAANESLSTYVSKLKQTVTKYSFLNVLESYDSKDSSKPSYLYTTDAALESADINLLYASFLDLFLNDKPLPDWNGKPYSTRRLAEDLAVGALLMGGVVNAKNYIRLIPPAYMYNIQGKNDSENYIDKLSNYVRTPNFGFLFDRVDMNAVVEQIVQNNPSMLPTKTDSDFTKRGGEYTIKEASDNMEQFVTIKRGKDEFTILARTTNGIYKELKNKDMRDFRNYNYTQASVTSPQSHIQLVDNSPKLEITPNKNIEETRDLGLKDGGKEVVDFALNMISTTSKSTYYRKLADLMKDMTKDKKIVVKTGRITNNKGEAVKGNYESSNGTATISINTDSNSYPMGMNELDLEESLLHELVHSISIDSYNKGKALMNQGKAGVAITTIIVSLDNLFADYQKKVKELKAQGLADNIPSNSTKDIYEFMSELFTNQDLQKLIDTMEYSKHRTLFQRFTELLEKLITALGFNLDTTTALALADIIELASMPEVNVADTDGNTIPDGSASRAFEKYFPTITEVINKYGVFKDGIRASYTNRTDADAKVNTINLEQGVYKASVYTQSNGTFAINLVRDSRMDNVDYAYEQLTQEGRNKLNNDIC